MTDLPLAPVPDDVEPDDWYAACSEVRDRCGWHIAPLITETITATVDLGGGLILPTLALEDVLSITDPDGVALDVSDFGWTPWGSVRATYGSPSEYSLSVRLPRSTRRYVLSVKHGFRSVPDSILRLLRSRAKRASLAESGSGYMTAGPFAMQVGSTAQGGGYSEQEERILDRYTLPWRA